MGLVVNVDSRVSPGTYSCCDVTAYKGEVGEASVTQVLPLSGIHFFAWHVFMLTSRRTGRGWGDVAFSLHTIASLEGLPTVYSP